MADIDLEDPSLYLNRELNRLEFVRFVLTEAEGTYHPLLERVKFLSIFCSNLDEFFMVRVSGLLRQVRENVNERTMDGMTPQEQLVAIRKALLPEIERQAKCWHEILRPVLRKEGIDVLSYGELDAREKAVLRRYFERNVLPALTPLAIDTAHPFPHISNLIISLIVELMDPHHGTRLARIRVPRISEVFPRLLRVPSEQEAEDFIALNHRDIRSTRFVWAEEVVAANLDMLFPGLEVKAAHAFRVTRDAEFEVTEDDAHDLLSTIEEGVGMRQFGSIVRLETDDSMPPHLMNYLIKNLDITASDVYVLKCQLGMNDMFELMKVDMPAFKDLPFTPSVPPALEATEDMFAVLRKQDLLMYNPYDSFSPFLDFVHKAARDPDVLAIKMSLYRIEKKPPLIEALMEARENGKQVAVLIELKARFDEESNIHWTRELEKAGVHVIYGVLGLKTHAKMCLIVRRERDGIRRYVHLSSGNYNSFTARIYSDISYFTSDPEIGADVSEVFNTITGYSHKTDYRKLLVAPGSIRDKIVSRIEREIEQHKKDGKGYLAFKLNNLQDKSCIQALYRASMAGVKVDLQVRGICCLRPGLKGVSENIRETTIVGRFLEHSRIYYFRNGGDEEILIGSSDLMPRNLYKRIEVLFPIRDHHLRDNVRDFILNVHLRDNVRSRVLRPDGSYVKVIPKEGEPVVDSQKWMIANRGVWHG